MSKQFIFLFSLFCAYGSTSHARLAYEPIFTDSITRVEMNLGAFGVESDNFPSINAYIDFIKDSSSCSKSYYNPKFKPSTYSLSKQEISAVLQLLKKADLGKLKTEYTSPLSDQPTSTIKIYAGEKIFIIEDYGLKADYPLRELYKIVYKY